MNETITTSGYTPCACRDCTDVTVSSDMAQPELCEECEEAGCTKHESLPGFIAGYGLGYECQRDDAPQCEGHADDDAALTSGVGIGESIYCDGSCVA